MTALEIGNALVALCRQGKNMDAIGTLYSPDIESSEAALCQVRNGKIAEEEFFYTLCQ